MTVAGCDVQGGQPASEVVAGGFREEVCAAAGDRPRLGDDLGRCAGFVVEAAVPISEIVSAVSESSSLIRLRTPVTICPDQ